MVTLEPVDSFPETMAVFTYGSVCAAGGAAAICPDSGAVRCLQVPAPHSTTHSELVAFTSPWRWVRR